MNVNNIITILKNPITPQVGTDATKYFVLAFLFGSFGIHNFWYGQPEKAKVQFLIGVVGSFVFGIGPIVAWVSAMLDALAYFGKDKNPEPTQTPPAQSK